MDWLSVEESDPLGQAHDKDGRPRFRNMVGLSGELNAYVPMEWGAYGGDGAKVGRQASEGLHPRWRSAAPPNGAAQAAASPKRSRHVHMTVGHAPRLRVDERGERPKRPAREDLTPMGGGVTLHPREPQPAPQAGRRQRVAEAM